jgi:hypothetical protein
MAIEVNGKEEIGKIFDMKTQNRNDPENHLSWNTEETQASAIVLKTPEDERAEILLNSFAAYGIDKRGKNCDHLGE